jgi:hypothetical protein
MDDAAPMTSSPAPRTPPMSVAVTFGLVELLIKARSVLVLIGLALFIAAGLDPAVSWLQRHGLRRWQAVLVTLAVLVAAVGGFLAAAIPPLAAQTTTLAAELPKYLHTLQNHNSQLGKLDAQYHIQDRLKTLLQPGAAPACGSGQPDVERRPPVQRPPWAAKPAGFLSQRGRFLDCLVIRPGGPGSSGPRSPHESGPRKTPGPCRRQ